MILALDPGATTGFVLAFGNGEVVTNGQWPYDHVWDGLCNITSPDVIVMEAFLFRQMTKVDYRPIEIIGVVKLFCRLQKIKLVTQTPAQVKHFYTDARLKERGLYRRGNPHANDAMRHLLYYLEFGEGKRG